AQDEKDHDGEPHRHLEKIPLGDGMVRWVHLRRRYLTPVVCVGQYNWMGDGAAQPANRSARLPTLITIERVLLGGDEPDERRRACLQEAGAILSALSAAALLGELSELLQLAPARREALLACVAAADHVGFLLPPGTDPERLGRIAAETHFPDD